MKNIVFFMNGPKEVGKDTFIDYFYSYQKCVNISSIDCIRNLLGIDKSDKRPETRKVLSNVGKELEEYNNYRTKATAALVVSELNKVGLNGDSNCYGSQPPVVFIHAREKYIINRISMYLRNNGFEDIYNLYITRPGLSSNSSNASDLEAAQEITNLEKNIYFYKDSLRFSTGIPNNTLIVDNSSSLENFESMVEYIATHLPAIKTVLNSRTSRVNDEIFNL